MWWTCTGKICLWTLRAQYRRKYIIMRYFISVDVAVYIISHIVYNNNNIKMKCLKINDIFSGFFILNSCLIPYHARHYLVPMMPNYPLHIVLYCPVFVISIIHSDIPCYSTIKLWNILKYFPIFLPLAHFGQTVDSVQRN